MSDPPPEGGWKNIKKLYKLFHDKNNNLLPGQSFFVTKTEMKFQVPKLGILETFLEQKLGRSKISNYYRHPIKINKVIVLGKQTFGVHGFNRFCVLIGYLNDAENGASGGN